MRLYVVAAAAVILACNKSENANPNDDGGSGGGGSTVHALTVVVAGGGRITSSPAGIDCGTACSAQFAAASVVVLTAVPDTGWTLKNWSGACSGAQACSVTMNADTAVTATFAQAPPGTFALSVAVQGSGRVTSAPPGIDCGAACSTRFDAGTQVALTAVAAAGWQFSTWTGCTGTQPCSVTMTGDAVVSATFTQAPPPPPKTFALSVAVQGSGTVTSAPAGIDCGAACSKSFDAGTQVALTAAPASGWKLSAWSGACSGDQACSVTLNADATVSAAFTAIPPPDACAGLLPAALPNPVVATLPDSECIEGTSDELGNYLLGYQNAGGSRTNSQYLFFTLTDGQAVHIGDTVSGGEYVSIPIFSQPSGFTAVRYGSSYGFPPPSTRINSYSHAGVFTSGMDLVPYDGDWDVGIDPDGGTALVRSRLSGAEWVTEYAHLDKTGALEVDWTPIDTGGHSAGIGVLLSGHVLVLETKSSALYGRWLQRSGAPITGWFGPIASGGEPRFLMDGSLVLSLGYPPQWQYRIADGATVTSPLPEWLGSRVTDSFSVIRNGAAYALWGTDNPCGTSQLEVVAATGKSCGCIHVPNLNQGNAHTQGGLKPASIGRDGSLIVPQPPANFGKCTYHLYPQLLK